VAKHDPDPQAAAQLEDKRDHALHPKGIALAAERGHNLLRKYKRDCHRPNSNGDHSAKDNGKRSWVLRRAKHGCAGDCHRAECATVLKARS